MIVEGYECNPFPFEIGDMLIDEDGDECILLSVSSEYCYVKDKTGPLANQESSCARTLFVHDWSKKA